MSDLINLTSRRALEARTGKKIGSTGYRLLVTATGGLVAASAAAFISGGLNAGFMLVSAATASLVSALWWKRRLSLLPADSTDLTGRLSADVLSRLKPGTAQHPLGIWQALSGHWQANFFVSHLLISNEVVEQQLSQKPEALQQALQQATRLADATDNPTVDVGFVVAGLLLSAPGIQQLLVKLKAQPADVENLARWLGRNLSKAHLPRRDTGGIGRDWAFGFTPLLDSFGQNISLSITRNGAQHDWLAKSPGVQAIETAFSNRTTAIALIGPDGIGKTSSVHALAQRLMEGDTGQSLAYHQVISLNATDIISRARGPGELEHTMLSLAGEAAHSGNIILFFDDAQLFFNNAPGAFDASQILLTIVQAQSVPMILAISPNDFQRLKSSNPSLAGLLTPVVLQELPEESVMHVLEDITVGLENKHRVLVAYEALREAYRLSGRYEQDEAYPGKAIKLLEQAISHASNSIVTAPSVQHAVEQTRGVKVGAVAPGEADELLHLEDNIHKRMINQSHAVGVVASALRRARAGVTNPRRPIGSFMFLGPTGVGKTELAKSVAATYFGSEEQMLRLDMSEYQQAEDVDRLLSTGQEDSSSLLMSVRQQPFSVVLLDEIEKAHPNILNLLLQLLDEGQLTDVSGRAASFKDCVIIATSNAGAQTIRDRVGRGESLESFSSELTDELINSGQFKPELLNRFDEMVFFRPLTPDELAEVVQLMLSEVNATLSTQNISVVLTEPAIAKIVAQGNDPRLGARPMRRALQQVVENVVAQKILAGDTRPGDIITLDAADLSG